MMALRAPARKSPGRGRRTAAGQTGRGFGHVGAAIGDSVETPRVAPRQRHVLGAMRDRTDDARHDRIGRIHTSIVHPQPILTGLDQPGQAQISQVARHGWLRQTHSSLLPPSRWRMWSRVRSPSALSVRFIASSCATRRLPGTSNIHICEYNWNASVVNISAYADAGRKAQRPKVTS